LCEQEIRDTGVAGYQYIQVEDDLAANVLYGNGALVHLSSEAIPADVIVSQNAHLFAHYIHALLRGRLTV